MKSVNAFLVCSLEGVILLNTVKVDSTQNLWWVKWFKLYFRPHWVEPIQWAEWMKMIAYSRFSSNSNLLSLLSIYSTLYSAHWAVSTYSNLLYQLIDFYVLNEVQVSKELSKYSVNWLLSKPVCVSWVLSMHSFLFSLLNENSIECDRGELEFPALHQSRQSVFKYLHLAKWCGVKSFLLLVCEIFTSNCKMTRSNRVSFEHFHIHSVNIQGIMTRTNGIQITSGCKCPQLLANDLQKTTNFASGFVSYELRILCVCQACLCVTVQCEPSIHTVLYNPFWWKVLLSVLYFHFIFIVVGLNAETDELCTNATNEIALANSHYALEVGIIIKCTNRWNDFELL